MTDAYVDTSTDPEALGNVTPGVGPNASAVDHVHPMPDLGDLTDVDVTGIADADVLTWSADAGEFRPENVLPLWGYSDNSLVTVPRAHTDDSGSYSSTPASGAIHYTYFIAQRDFSCGHINFSTGGTGPSVSTVAKVGLYSVDPSTLALTQMSASTNQTSWSGTYAAKNIALAVAQDLTRGGLYAVANLQVADTPASLLGVWDNLAFAGATPRIGTTHAGQSDLLGSDTNGAVSTHQFYMAYILKA